MASSHLLSVLSTPRPLSLHYLLGKTPFLPPSLSLYPFLSLLLPFFLRSITHSLPQSTLLPQTHIPTCQTISHLLFITLQQYYIMLFINHIYSVIYSSQFHRQHNNHYLLTIVTSATLGYNCNLLTILTNSNTRP